MVGARAIVTLLYNAALGTVPGRTIDELDFLSDSLSTSRSSLGGL